MTTTPSHRHPRQTSHSIAQRDGGYTLMELLLVVSILGILGTVVVLSVSGIRTEAAETGCQADRHQLSVAAEAYFAQTGAKQIVAAGVGHNRFEQTLVDADFLRAPSSFHDLDTNGVVTPQGNSSC